MSTMHPYDQPDAQPKKKSRIKKVALWVGGIFLAFALLGSCLESDDEPEAPAEPTATAVASPEPTETAQDTETPDEASQSPEPTTEAAPEPVEEETTEPETVEESPEPVEAVEEAVEFDRDMEMLILATAMDHTFDTMSSSEMSDICFGWSLDAEMQDMMLDVFMANFGDLSDFDHLTDGDVRAEVTRVLNGKC